MKVLFSIATLSLFSLVFAFPALAEINVNGLQFFSEAHGSLGYSSSTAQVGYQSPNLAQFGLGAMAAYEYQNKWLVGLSSDLSFMNQYNSVGSTAQNFKGHRWNILAPTVGIKLSEAIITVDFEFLGSYVLAATSRNGGNASYQSPLGFTLKGIYPVWDQVIAGLQFEYLSFSTYSDSVTGESSLATHQKIWQIALLAGYSFN